MSAYVCLLVITFWSKVPYLLQVAAFLGLLYLMGVYNLFISAQTGDGFPFMMVAPFLTALLMGKRAGWITLAVETLTLFVFCWAFVAGHLVVEESAATELSSWLSRIAVFVMLNLLLMLPQTYLFRQLTSALGYSQQLTTELEQQQAGLESEVIKRTQALQEAYAEVEQQVETRTAELTQEIAARERIEKERAQLLEEQAVLQQDIIDAQREALKELSTPVIPVMERILVMPLVGGIDTMRAREIMRTLLEGISEYRAKFVILDVTGVPIMDTGIVNHINKTIQAARLKGAEMIVTGISDTVAEAIVDLGIDWDDVMTLADLQTGLRIALSSLAV